MCIRHGSAPRWIDDIDALYLIRARIVDRHAVTKTLKDIANGACRHAGNISLLMRIEDWVQRQFGRSTRVAIPL